MSSHARLGPWNRVAPPNGVSCVHDDLASLTVAPLADLILRRRLSSVELTRALVERIELLDPQIRAFITHTPECALQQAKQADDDMARGRHCGPLHGIPFGVKDICETAGIRTTANSRLLLNNVPSRDAAVVTKMREAGGVLM